MEIIGRILKENRIRKNLTIHEISMVTKINSRIIKAIEKGNLNELPSKSFLRGFIRSYASYLKIDVNEILRTFQEELGSTLYQPTQEGIPQKSQNPQRKTSNKAHHPLSFLVKQSFSSYIFWTLGILSLIFLIVEIRNLVEKYKLESLVNFSPQTLKGAKTLEKNPKQEPLLDEKLANENLPYKLSPKINSKNLPQKKPSQKKLVSPLKPSSPSQTSPPTSEPTRPTPASSAYLLKKPNPPKVLEKPIQKTTNETSSPFNELILEASQNVKILLTQPKNKTKREVSLKKNQVHVIKFSNPLQLRFNDGGAINIIHNGKDKGILGKKGLPFQIEYR